MASRPFKASQTMHPVIRIVTFLVYTLFVAFGGYPQLVLSIALLGLFYLLAQGTGSLWPASWQMLKRMRWLFLSMLVVYFWFTPGQVVFSQLADYSPTWQGIKMGVFRIGSLVVIVAALNIIIRSTAQELMVSGLLWLLAPLRRLGLPHERLALRIVLTFNMISEIQYEYNLLKRTGSDSADDKSGDAETTGFLQRLDRLGEVGASLFKLVLDKAQQQSAEKTIEIPSKPAPPLVQWLLPVLLAAGFVAV